MEREGKSGALREIAAFQYPGSEEEISWPEGAGWLGTDPTAKTAKHPEEPHDQAAIARENALRAEFERRLAEEAARSFEAGRERGHQEGRKAEAEAQAAARKADEQERVRQAAELIEGIAEQRDAYLRAVEREVVELALAIAARVLRREAQMDPLLLTGAVRVALGQLAGATEARLKVPAAELDLWTEAMGAVPKLALRPAVLVGEGMRGGECILEAEMGSVDLGIRPQLSEIERGFFDQAGNNRPRPPARLERDARGVGEGLS